jgi:hypothetical protein
MSPQDTNALIDKALDYALDGNKGSNILVAVLVPLLGAHINWSLALGCFECPGSEAELCKVFGLVLIAVFGYLVGKKKP